jgi:5-formyltetrahydrofolate cyclo-ligase
MAQRHLISAAQATQRLGPLVEQLALTIQTQYPHATIALYRAHAGEPDIAQLAQRLQNPLCLPVVVGKGQALRFARWQQGEPLLRDIYGIETPAQPHWVWPTVLLIPCLGYSASGFRLGYGGGYYDRTLAEMSERALVKTAETPVAIGVAWRQAVCSLAPEPHDVPMQRVFVA